VKKKTVVALVLLFTFIAGVLPLAFAGEDAHRTVLLGKSVVPVTMFNSKAYNFSLTVVNSIQMAKVLLKKQKGQLMKRTKRLHLNQTK